MENQEIQQEQKCEYSIFFNGSSWVCEIEDDDGVDDWCTGNTPIEALENALKIVTSNEKVKERIDELANNPEIAVPWSEVKDNKAKTRPRTARENINFKYMTKEEIQKEYGHTVEKQKRDQEFYEKD